jgi:MoaA/NifB/PqqE/SkfB family radical SAM enzyme
MPQTIRSDCPKVVREPKRLDIHLGYNCDNNCIFCCIGYRSRDKNLDTQDILAVLRSAARDGVRKISFSGGEPFVRKDIVNIIEYCKKLKFRQIQAITNGRQLANPQLAHDVANAGLTTICVSAHSHRPNVCNYFANNKDHFDKMTAALRNLSRYDLGIGSNIVVMKQNYRELSKTVEFLINRGINLGVTLVNLIPCDNAWDNRKRIVPRISNVIPYVIKALEFGKSTGFRVRAEGFPFCMLQGYEEFIDEFSMASRWKAYTPDGYQTNHLSEIRSGKTRISRCNTCAHSYRCGGIWAHYADMFGLSELKSVRLSSVRTPRISTFINAK